MREIKDLFENNRKWAAGLNPETLKELAVKQTPKYLWIGCADSRVPPNEILGLPPGEVFVHRNIANLFPHTDFNCLSVLQYAIDYLQIEHVIVCGHYGCGGIAAALENAQFGLIDNWLRHIRDIAFREQETLASFTDPALKAERLVELNVLQQVMNICHTTIVQNAWSHNRKLAVHGWVYDISTGLLKDLNCCISSLNQIADTYRTPNLH